MTNTTEGASILKAAEQFQQAQQQELLRQLPPPRVRSSLMTQVVGGLVIIGAGVLLMYLLS